VNASNLSQSELDRLVEDVQALKRDVAKLAEHSRGAVWNGAADTANAIGAEAQRLYDEVATKGRDQVKRVSGQVQEKPIMSILIAFGIGFLGGRILR
jgi:ElaB/YqjD/DUF883 family membrane-anchored ribosome-binding protein